MNNPDISTLLVPKALHQKLKYVTVLYGVTIKTATVEALENWLDNKASELQTKG